jgi:hypothetical protein
MSTYLGKLVDILSFVNILSASQHMATLKPRFDNFQVRIFTWGAFGWLGLKTYLSISISYSAANLPASEAQWPTESFKDFDFG